MRRHLVTGGELVNRVMRMGIGLVSLIIVLGFAGSVYEGLGVEDGEAVGWLVLAPPWYGSC